MGYQSFDTDKYLSKGLQKTLSELAVSPIGGIFSQDGSEDQTAFYYFCTPSAQTCTVLFHGAGNDALFGWQELIIALTRAGRSVLSLDMAGHGAQSRSWLNQRSLLDIENQLLSLLPKLLQSELKLEAIGYSLGALIAAQTVARKSLPWQKLVLIALPERIQLSRQFFTHELMTIFNVEIWRQWLRFGSRATLPSFGPIGRRQRPIRLEPEIKISYPKFIDHIFHTLSMSKITKDLDLPILLLYGERDYLATSDYGIRLRKLFQQAEFIEVRNASHWIVPMLPSTAKVIQTWLKQKSQS